LRGENQSYFVYFNGHFPSNKVWYSSDRDYNGSCAFTFNPHTEAVTLDGVDLGNVPLPLSFRRFCWHLSIEAEDGQKRERLTGH